MSEKASLKGENSLTISVQTFKTECKKAESFNIQEGKAVWICLQKSELEMYSVADKAWKRRLIYSTSQVLLKNTHLK